MININFSQELMIVAVQVADHQLITRFYYSCHFGDGGALHMAQIHVV